MGTTAEAALIAIGTAAAAILNVCLAHGFFFGVKSVCFFLFEVFVREVGFFIKKNSRLKGGNLCQDWLRVVVSCLYRFFCKKCNNNNNNTLNPTNNTLNPFQHKY